MQRFAFCLAAIAVPALAGGCDDGGDQVSVSEHALSAARRGCYATVSEIGPASAVAVYAQDINNAGVVVGSFVSAPGGLHQAFRYTDRGGFEDLGATAGLGLRSFASAISGEGVITGHRDSGSGVMKGFRAAQGGAVVDVCAGGCSVWDVNGLGELAGLIMGEGTAYEAFTYSDARGLVRLGTLGGARSSAGGLDDEGHVVGHAQLAGSPGDDVGHAFLYTATTGMRDLNELLGSESDWELKAANDVRHGRVVGTGLRRGQKRAFLYTIATGQVSDLGTPAGTSASSAFGVNAHGEVVGYAEAVDGAGTKAFVYTARLGMRALDDFVAPGSGWRLQQAMAINNRGQIVGFGLRDGRHVGYKLALPSCARPQ